MKTGALFTGYGGLELGVSGVLDSDVVWCAETDRGACAVLAHRWPDVPNIGDVTQVDWRTVEPVDVLTGGFPCQDVSAAGRRAGMRPSTRSGLWAHMLHATATLRPRLVVIENVRGLLSADAHSDVEPCSWCLGDDTTSDVRALGAVLGDLAVIGYDTRWHGLRAADVGAPHGRFRVFITAWDAAADTGRIPGQPRRFAASEQATSGAALSELAGRRRAHVAADTDSARLQRHRRLHAAPGEVPASAQHRRAWGHYADAIARWEHITGRAAPVATDERRRLSPVFVEWLMGLPAGHVTGVPGVSRSEQLRMLGNGVVPQQAEAALRYLLDTQVAA